MKAWGHCFRVRSSGGMVYVPRCHEEELAKLDRIVSSIGDCSLHWVEATGNGKARSSLATSAARDLGQQIAEHRAQIDEWLAGTCEPRLSTMDGIMEQFATLKDSAQLFQDTLQMEADDFAADIEEAKSELLELMGMAEERVMETYAVGPRTLDKLRDAIVEGDNGDAVITTDTAQASSLGGSWTNNMYRWGHGKRHWVAARQLGYDVVEAEPGKVRLTRLQEADSAA